MSAEPTTEVGAVTVREGRADAGQELRILPPSEPLASCAFEWPAEWSVERPRWRPPPLFAPSRLLELSVDDGRLEVWVARFGCEVDGLAFLQWWRPGGWRALGWRGLSVARGRRDDVEWRVVHSGPALHLLAARGTACDHLDRAALSLRTLSGRPPPAEPTAPLAVGPLRTLRFDAWRCERWAEAPHGYAGARLWLENPRAECMSQLWLWVADRRVHVGLDPRALVEHADGRRAELPGLELGEGAADPGADGAADDRPSRLDGVAVHARRALRQVGPGLVVLDGVWPAREHAPVAWLNARRHFDVLLAMARGAG